MSPLIFTAIAIYYFLLDLLCMFVFIVVVPAAQIFVTLTLPRSRFMSQTHKPESS